MTREFVWTTAFISGWKRCGFDEDDLMRLENALLDDPKAGDVIEGTGGARKFRFEYEGRGKSGSTRVIYVDFEVGEKICGLAIYPKAAKDSLDKGEKNAIKKLITKIEPFLQFATWKGGRLMPSVFEDIMSSLNELAEFAEGRPTGVVVHKRSSEDVINVPSFSPQEIRQVRLDSNMSQKTFAACVGVSKKSVEAWEGGRSHPDGAARRILGLMRDHPTFAKDMGLLIAQ